MRNLAQTLEWYDTHRTSQQIGFSVDKQCLNVCHTARGLPAKYPSAKAAQDATPKEHRFYEVSQLRKGMVLFYDDPNDSNPFGHVVTMVGRVRGADMNDIHDVLVVTNAVQHDQLTIVRGDYFPQHWGDAFQFGADWLNGFTLDVNHSHSLVQDFKEEGPLYHVGLLDGAAAKGRADAKRARDVIDNAINTLPTTGDAGRVRSYYKSHRIIRLGLLRRATSEGSNVKSAWSQIKTVIDSLPDR